MKKKIIIFVTTALVGTLIVTNGCKQSNNTSSKDGNTITQQKVKSKRKQQIPISINKQNNDINITREFNNKEVSFKINPSLVGGEVIKHVWKEVVPNKSFDRNNSIIQLSRTVLLYRKFPNEVKNQFYYYTQPVELEFMDTTFSTIKRVDIWNNRPYQHLDNSKITYYHFDSENQEVIPYKEQKTKLTPTEYSLFTEVRSEGNHVIVNYALRALAGNKIIGNKQTLKIFDLNGNMKYELKDLTSVDGAVVSNNGKYMMFTFGGTGLATANNPFGTMEREGWALMRLKDQKVVYQEYTDNGKLAFNRLWKDTESDLICLAYSTPNLDDNLRDYAIFFDFNEEKVYKKQWSEKEWEKLLIEFDKTKIKSWEYYIHRFNFEIISLDE